MSEVKVEYGESAQDTAILLLEAAEKAGEEASVVRTGEGAFFVPEELAKSAGVDYETEDGDAKSAPKEPAKKAAKKAPAKKVAAKKASATKK